MKTFTISAVLLASANSVLAQDQYYNLVASAPGAAFDAALLKPYDRYWHIGVEANSTCGDVAPGVAVIGENLVVYNDGRSHQQYGYVDISGTADGLLALTPANTVGGSPKGFELRGAEADQIYLYSNNTVTSSNQFLACEDGSAAGQYWVYPADSYAKSVGKDACVEFQIRADAIEKPTTSCTYY